MEIKTPRFLSEYANYQYKIIDSSAMPQKQKDMWKHYVWSHVTAVKRGYETLSDCMDLISLRGINMETGNLYIIEQARSERSE